MTKISEILAISRNVIADYLLYMEEAGMIAQLRDDTNGIRGLGKINKVYVDNTNLVYVLAGENANKGNIRETFFLNQCRVHHQIVSSNMADFKMVEKDFELGGKSKGLKQIETAENGFLVKDDIETGFFNTIPLWHFGLMY
jgi:predicted AAA+ superfamily ATPase